MQTMTACLCVFASLKAIELLKCNHLKSISTNTSLNCSLAVLLLSITADSVDVSFANADQEPFQ